ncbi:MAG: glycosyltransferase family 4 protein [Planctomycetota bacterium]
MKRAILVTCYFPPDGGAGAQRPRKLAEHARRCGWDLTVITRQPPNSRSSWEPKDETLVHEGSHARVVRLPMPEQSTAGQMVPGPAGHEDPFLANIFAEVRSRVKTQPVDAVIVTMPPYGMSPVASRIKKEIAVPVFVDLQDPWALDGACSYSNKAQWAVTHRWMQEVLGLADGVIANTPEAGVQLRRAVPGLTPQSVEVVNNGCTVSEFEGPMPPRPEGMAGGKLHVVHTGTLHSHAFERTRGLVGRLRKRRNYRAENIQIGGRTAYHLLRAIDLLGKRRPETVEDLQLALVGVEDAATRRIVDESPRRDRVHLTGFVPYQESVAWIRHADILFVPLFGLPAGHRSRIIPSKTYEYLASGLPIVGALPEGDARSLVEESGRGFTADPCDDAGLAQALSRAIEYARASGPEPAPLQPFVHEYDWSRLCERFFDALHRWTGGPIVQAG